MASRASFFDTTREIDSIGLANRSLDRNRHDLTNKNMRITKLERSERTAEGVTEASKRQSS